MAQWYFLHRSGRVTAFVLNKDIALKNVLLRAFFHEKAAELRLFITFFEYFIGKRCFFLLFSLPLCLSNIKIV